MVLVDRGPLYKITVLDGNRRRDVEIDVTRSASSFLAPGDGIKSVLRTVLSNPALGINDVVEFGAGKLKNSPLVLQMGKTLCAVEFERLSSNPVAKRNYSLCHGYGEKFRRLTPDQFYEDGKKYDLALLVNVLATMPFVSDRVSILEALRDKLRDGKFALIFWLKNDDRYEHRRAEGKECTDGIWLGDGRRYQTFYKRYTLQEMVGLMHNAGFVPFDRFRVDSNHALLFRK